MARFLVTYYIGAMAQDRESVAAARAEFALWARTAGRSVADLGTPVRSTTTLTRDGAIAATAGELLGWSVIEAASETDAAKIMQCHPFLGRGGVVRISAPV